MWTQKQKKTSFIIYRIINVGKGIVGDDKQKCTKHICYKKFKYFHLNTATWSISLSPTAIRFPTLIFL